jgi:hypothetical protein
MPRSKNRIGKRRRKYPKGPRIPPPPVTGPCVLYKLPVEIREQIFSMMLDLKVRLKWEGKTPTLLITLLQKPDLYHEAFRIFRKKNIFRFEGTLSITFKKPEFFGRMSLNAIRNIERLELSPESVLLPLLSIVRHADGLQHRRLSPAKLCTQSASSSME